MRTEEVPAAAPPAFSDITAPEEFSPKTGTSQLMMKTPPEFIEDMEPYEPIAQVRDNMRDDCTRRERERAEHPENIMNRVVYDCLDPAPHQLVDPREGELAPYYLPSSAEDCTLVFESRFETGNLRRAIQVYEFEYDLILKYDYNTKGNTQWYYFSVSNTREGKTYRFNIVNMMKPDSLYNYGMRPLMYSVTDAMRYRRGWARCGQDICYYQNSIKRKQGGFYFTLTFDVTLPYDSDTVYFAHCYPYTYTDLNNYLNRITADPRKRGRVRRKVLCQSIAGNNIELLTITSFQSDPESINRRKGIVLMCRVHPGETNASWMMKGFIDYLTGPTLDAKILRDHFVFKIIPMLNPDGVINGSYRCSLSGVDLNRCWVEPNKKLHPCIYNAKAMIKKFCEDREVVLCCDLHGHSRKKNIFMYGCTGRARLKERVFPKLLEKCSEIFSFNDCVFGIQKSKEATARIVIWREMGIINSYTLEASFCGSDFGRHADFHFNTEHYQEIAHNFCDALNEFCNPDQGKVKALLDELEMLFPPESDDESDSGSADSDFSNDERKKKKKKNLPKKKKDPADKRKKALLP